MIASSLVTILRSATIITELRPAPRTDPAFLSGLSILLASAALLLLPQHTTTKKRALATADWREHVQHCPAYIEPNHQLQWAQSSQYSQACSPRYLQDCISSTSTPWVDTGLSPKVHHQLPGLPHVELHMVHVFTPPPPPPPPHTHTHTTHPTITESFESLYRSVSCT